MTISSFPFENADTDESQYTLLFREFVGSGVLDSYDGVGLSVAGSGSALQVTLAPGDAIVRGFMMRNDADYVINVDANSSGATRYDRIVLRLDPAANSIVPAYVKPPSGAGPQTAEQTDTAAYELPIARITVANGATNLSGAVVDERPFVNMRTGIWTTERRPGTAGYAPAPRRGQIGFNVTLGAWEFYNGSTWASLIPAVNSVSNWTSLGGTDYQLHVGVNAPATPSPTTIWIKPTP